jgi:hypothetical protein
MYKTTLENWWEGNIKMELFIFCEDVKSI